MEVVRVQSEVETQRKEEFYLLHKVMDASPALALEERVWHLPTSHATELEELRTKLQLSLAKVVHVQSEDKQHRLEEMNRLHE